MDNTRVRGDPAPLIMISSLDGAVDNDNDDNDDDEQKVHLHSHESSFRLQSDRSRQVGPEGIGFRPEDLYRPRMLAVLLLLIPQVASRCVDDGVEHNDGDKWVRNGNFLVTCAESEIKVLNCLTDAGTLLELGTSSHVENGVEYSCMDDEPMFEGSGEEISVKSCPDNADGSDDITIGNFLICCISKRFKGCVDAYGDSIKSGHFVLGNSLLKYCNIQKGGMRARIEPKGCFNGTRTDDVEDVSLHVKKYAVWRQGAYDMRCGDDGIQVYKCYVGGKGVYVGQAWIDKEGVVNICK